MSVAIIVLGIMYLKGVDCGTALAVCSIVTGVCELILATIKEYKKREEY